MAFTATVQSINANNNTVNIEFFDDAVSVFRRDYPIPPSIPVLVRDEIARLTDEKAKRDAVSTGPVTPAPTPEPTAEDLARNAFTTKINARNTLVLERRGVGAAGGDTTALETRIATADLSIRTDYLANPVVLGPLMRELL